MVSHCQATTSSFRWNQWLNLTLKILLDEFCTNHSWMNIVSAFWRKSAKSGDCSYYHSGLISSSIVCRDGVVMEISANGWLFASGLKALTVSFPSQGTVMMLTASVRISLLLCTLGGEMLPQLNYPGVIIHCHCLKSIFYKCVSGRKFSDFSLFVMFQK